MGRRFKVIIFKACPRCDGDVHINRDMYGEYRECLMCGFMADIQKPSLLEIDMAGAKKESKRGGRTRTTERAA